MWIGYFIVFLCSCAAESSAFWEEKSYLEDELYRNLKEKFKDEPFTNSVQNQIDSLLDQFDELTFRPDVTRSKRSTPEKEETLILNGLTDLGSIPASFAKDICLFRIDKTEYASVLHFKNTKQPEKSTILSIFRKINHDDYECVYNKSIPFIVSIDCVDVEVNAYVALAIEITPENGNLGSYSPVYKIQENGKVSVVQTTVIRYQRFVRLWKYGNDVFLMYTYTNGKELGSIASQYVCPIYRLSSGLIFEIWTELPCSNAIYVEPFTILSDLYVGVANKMDIYNNTKLVSAIYKYDFKSRNFVQFQNIITKSVIGFKYFSFKVGEEMGYFLTITSNEIISPDEVQEIDSEGYSFVIIYKFIADIFMPLQNIFVESPIQVLPHTCDNGEQILLISSSKQDVLFYHYTGWKFEDTKLPQPNPAFDSSVSNFRSYTDLNGTSMIVVANSKLYGSSSNLFAPVFRINQADNLYQGILEWCENSITELNKYPLEEILSKLESVNGSENVTQFNGDVEFENIQIDQLITKDLQTQNGSLNEENVNDFNSIHEAVLVILDKLDNLETEMDEIFDNFGRSNISKEVILGNAKDELFFDHLQVDNLQAKTINGRKVANLLHINEDMLLNSVKCQSLRVSGPVTLSDYKHKELLSNALLIGHNQSFKGDLYVRNVTVDHLTIKKNINLKDIKHVLQNYDLEKNYYKVEILRVGNLTSLINGVNFQDLYHRALKLNGEQTLNSVNIEKLTVGHNLECIKLCSNRNVSDMWTIRGSEEPIIIHQDIQFAGDVVFHNLEVKNRLKNIPVRKDGSLAVLLKNNPNLQSIKGDITFENVRLMEPITLQGKIKSSSLTKMNPNIVTNDDLSLDGDFEIVGPVNVTNRLTIDGDLFGKSTVYSMKKLMDLGVMENETEINGDFYFDQPIKANRIHVHLLNNIPVHDFVKINHPEVQIITGEKHFTTPIFQIKNGVCEAHRINNVDVLHLNQTVLRKSGNQRVTGWIHFKKLEIYRILAKEADFSGHNFNNLFSNDEEFTFPKIVTSNSEFIISKNLSIDQLILKDKSIFGYDWIHLVEDTVYKNQENVFITGKKEFTELDVQNLEAPDEFGRFNSLPENGQISTKLQDINLDSITCKNLYFGTTLNGIHKERFGRTWLEVENEQVFTEPQIFHKLSTDNIILNGQLCSSETCYDVQNALEDTYLINRPEHLGEVQFENGIKLLEDLIVNGMVSGIKIPEDLILGNESVIQKLVVENSVLEVDGKVNIQNSLNGVDLSFLRDFLFNQNQIYPQNLTIIGSAKLNREPAIQNFNHLNLRNLHDNAWMYYELPALECDLFIQKAVFHSDIYLQGPLNNVKLPHFLDNYFSLSRPQEVFSRLHFVDEVISLDSTITEELNAFLIKSTFSDLNLKNFAENVVKKDGRTQTISGYWTFDEITLHNDINGVLLNGMNLATDMVILNDPSKTVTSMKMFEDLFVNNLHCPQCSVQDVVMNDWIMKAVFLNGNYRLQGVTMLLNPIFQSIKVFGLVNNISFNRHSILSRTGDQIIDRDLYIDNVRKNHLQTLSIVRLDIEHLNDINDLSLLSEIVQRADNNSQSCVRNTVEFKRKIITEELNCNGSLFDMYIKNLEMDMGMKSLMEQQSAGLELLLRIASSDEENYTANHVHHFAVRQTIPESLIFLEPFIELGFVHPIYYLMSVSNRTPSQLEFYSYRAEVNRFVKGNIGTIFSGRITQVKTLYRAGGQALIFTETYLLQTRMYQQYLLAKSHDHKLVILFEAAKYDSHSLDLVVANGLDYVAVHSKFAKVLTIYSVVETNGGGMSLVNPILIEKKSVKQVIGLGGRSSNLMVILTENKLVELFGWNRSTGAFDQKLVLSVVNPSQMTTVHFRGHYFIAVYCLDDTSRRNSASFGSIEIFVLANSKAKHFQTLSNLPVIELKFAVLTSNELVLYVLTNSPTAPILVFQYSGVARFTKLIGNSVIPIGIRMNCFSLSDLHKDFAVVVTREETLIIEAVSQ